MFLSLALSACLMTTPPPSTPPADLATAALLTVHTQFAQPSGDYAEFSDGKRAGEQPAFNWSVGVTLSALNAAAAFDPKYQAPLEAYLSRVDRYWNTAGPVPGFDVLPGPPHPNDRYYDDNAWMVMALAESAIITRNERWFKRAEESLKYVMSGESDTLGGGVYWKEREKTSKNTCSNGPSAAAALDIYEVTKNQAYQDFALRTYEWTVKHLRDPDDNLYWDNLTVDERRLEKMKWSYNTALMVKAGWELGKHPGQSAKREEALASARAAVKHWIDPKSGHMKCEGRFAHLLFEVLLQVEREGKVELFDELAVLRGVATLRDANGLFGKRWDRPAEPGTTRYEILDQMAFVRIAFLVAKR